MAVSGLFGMLLMAVLLFLMAVRLLLALSAIK